MHTVVAEDACPSLGTASPARGPWHREIGCAWGNWLVPSPRPRPGISLRGCSEEKNQPLCELRVKTGSKPCADTHAGGRAPLSPGGAGEGGEYFLFWSSVPRLRRVVGPGHVFLLSTGELPPWEPAREKPPGGFVVWKNKSWVAGAGPHRPPPLPKNTFAQTARGQILPRAANSTHPTTSTSGPGRVLQMFSLLGARGDPEPPKCSTGMGGSTPTPSRTHRPSPAGRETFFFTTIYL